MPHDFSHLRRPGRDRKPKPTTAHQDRQQRMPGRDRRGERSKDHPAMRGLRNALTGGRKY
jgi:hypothetical protein